MDANDFISLAGKLAASVNAGEATYRTAVSRAYYGAFHLAASFLAELGFSAPRTANVHVFCTTSSERFRPSSRLYYRFPVERPTCRAK